MFIKSIAPLLFAIFLVSCGESLEQKQKKEYDELHASVMFIHDDVMPKTQDLYKVKQYSKENIEVLGDTSSFTPMLIEASVNAEKADEVMMVWMAQFQEPEGTHEERMVFLNDQLKKIKEVRKEMLVALADGKKLIKKTDHYIETNKLR